MEVVMAHEGMSSLPSARPVTELLDRLEGALAAKGITVFARIDHAAGAASVGLPLRPTSVLIFGNPVGGTPLMQAEPLIGLDLPLRILAWQDADGRSWLSWHDPAWLVRNHGMDPDKLPPVAPMTALLRAVSSEAAT
jgi:uncharacterized protein (DUF302 family)